MFFISNELWSLKIFYKLFVFSLSNYFLLYISKCRLIHMLDVLILYVLELKYVANIRPKPVTCK
jgi:hypothetical protein